MSGVSAGPPVAQDDYDRAMQKAMRLLGIRARSRREIADRLGGAGFDDTTVGAVEARLGELALLDDAAFAAEVCASRRRAGWSAARIAQDLRSRGVSHDVIDRSLEEADLQGGSDADRARELAVRKARGCGAYGWKALHKVVRHLAGKGYEPELAWEAARAAFRDLEEIEVIDPPSGPA